MDDLTGLKASTQLETLVEKCQFPQKQGFVEWRKESSDPLETVSLYLLRIFTVTLVFG
jgi:hypothetical protein